MALSNMHNKVAISAFLSNNNGVPSEIEFDYGYDELKTYRLDEDYPYRMELEFG